MAESNDGCLHRTGRQKLASSKEAGTATIFMLEELGDARLHCAQLTHYIDLARQIVEKSKAKDHIYEVAGHLLTAIPTHLFKLEKSLQAVALAADRMDYEEIKAELKPDKVQELERVLKDVRIRTVNHRSDQRPTMNPVQASNELQKIAAQTRATGKIPVAKVAELIAALEGQDRTASSASAADLFEEMGKALVQPSASQPKRLHLAAVLRRALMDNMDTGDFQTMSGGLPVSPEEQEARRSRFEKNKPADPTENMSPEDAKEWEAKNEEHKDNFKEAALDPGPLPRMEQIKSNTLVAYRRGNAGNWRMALMTLVDVVEDIGILLNELAGGKSDGPAKAALLNREVIKVRRGLRASGVEIMHQEMDTLGYTASERTKEAYISPSPDKLWVTMKESVDGMLESRVKNRKLGDMLQTVLEDASGVVFTNNYNNPQVREVRDTLYDLDHAVGMAFRQVEHLQRTMQKTMMPKTAQADECYSRFEEGKPADPTKDMSPEDAAEWKQNTEEHKDEFKSATSEDDHLSRHEEGKPVDPTKDMSPEDAAKWKQNTEEHKDDFKEASRRHPVLTASDWKVAGRTKHLEGKSGHTLCGEEADPKTIVDSVKDSTCHYCVQAWKKSHGGL